MKYEEMAHYVDEDGMLSPPAIKLFHPTSDDLRVCMTLSEDRSWVNIKVSLALPFTNPSQYIGLRDSADKQIGMIKNIADLDTESREVLQWEIVRRYFTPQVIGVRTAKEQYGTITWVVDTNHGERRFLVRNIRDNSQVMGANRVILTDTEGNRYEFPSVSDLGSAAQTILMKVM